MNPVTALRLLLWRRRRYWTAVTYRAEYRGWEVVSVRDRQRGNRVVRAYWRRRVSDGT